jgi:hypothetical protein
VSRHDFNPVGRHPETKHRPVLVVNNPTRPYSGEQVALPLSEVLARLEESFAAGQTTIAVTCGNSHHVGGDRQRRDTYWVLAVGGESGRRLLLLLSAARARRFDTVRITTGPYGPLVGVSRRRHRPRTVA